MKELQTGQKKGRLVKSEEQNTVEKLYRRLTIGERRIRKARESVGK
jgi:hypothetical protein